MGYEFDREGHIIVRPRDICSAIRDSARLINDVLIPGTPAAFPTYAKYCDFQASCADAFGVHPRNILVRGSSKVGFSLSPQRDRVWVEMNPDSDIDLAIVDPDYYHYLDREIRNWERNPHNQAFVGNNFDKSIGRQRQRAFYTYRYFDLPRIGCVQEHDQRVRQLPVEACCDLPRPIDAFVFRDWWSAYSRWECDIRELRRALDNGQLAAGGDQPVPFGSPEA